MNAAVRRRLRAVLGVFAIGFAISVGFAIRRAGAPSPDAAVRPTAPDAVVESTGGRIERFTLAREDVVVEYERQVTYADGSTRMFGVEIVTTDRDRGRTFTVEGREGWLGQNESTIVLEGDVRLEASDGLAARAARATYADADGVVRAEGPVAFDRGRLHGSGIGMTYDKTQDALALLEAAVIRIDPDGHGAGGADITAGSATYARRAHAIRFEQTLHFERDGRTIEADRGIARLTEDDARIAAIELRGRAAIAGIAATSGGLRSLGGEAVDLKYQPDGQTLEHALVAGGAALEFAGTAAATGRRLEAGTIDLTLAADGTTPAALVAHQEVVLTLPGAKTVPTRTIRAADLDARGEAGRGLTAARFSGGVDYRESGIGEGRAARSRTLEVETTPGLGDIQEARFVGGARFEEGRLLAAGAAARYLVGPGTLALSGSEAGLPAPRVVNDRIRVDAERIDLALDGPKVSARDSVQSELKPPADARDRTERLPSMLDRDRPVNVTADALDYDGTASKAVYTGRAQLWQGDTSVKAAAIVLDTRTGNLTADGPVTTTTMLGQRDPDRRIERVRSIGTAASFVYDEQLRRATWAGGAHLSGPQGDMTADRIELYLKPSAGELERAEAYDEGNGMTLREQQRTTTGSRLTYTAADDRYAVAGTPVKIVDQCGRETTGRTLIFQRATDSIVVDGNGFRTQTKGGAGCR
ncbi:MAG: LPS export ABC transporter periplasmic protein LptC [Acidobacteria bacterium]|nr:LPS export ABC transporter periplasmic protein LptC [Acidobacteriota bacterium]